MDILTLGKMNAMARDVDVTLEYLANATFQGLKDTCGVQTGMQAGLDATANETVAFINSAGPNMGMQEKYIYNDCARGCWCFTGVHEQWTVPAGTKTVMFEVWSGGGAGAGHCCQGCYCDMASCASQGGTYVNKTLCKEAGHFIDGTVYDICAGDGGNSNNGTGCWTACCDAPRGCASYVTGSGLNNFCAPGGRGGYNLYCTCRCNMNYCWQDNNECMGVFLDGTAQCAAGSSCGVDMAHASHNNQFFKTRGNCDCNSRYTTTGSSHKLENSLTQHIEDSMAQCGCETPCRSFRYAGGGMNNQKSYCGNWLCACLGTPGHSGLVKITYA
jgi:hypothetical protein|tara:strand:- start:4137 stop:5123 length:987 start_codon:yes stop_codon:yes gene_type:complete